MVRKIVDLGRRARLPFLAIAAGCAGTGSAQPTADQMAQIRAMANVPLTVLPLRGGAYWVRGGISNTGFVVGDNGVVAIDPQYFRQHATAERAAIARITPKPVDVMILTHADPDHVDGLPGWPRGLEIVAQENARAEIEANLTAADQPHPPEVRAYLPTHVVRFAEDMVRNGVRLRLLHPAAGHTDGDLIVYLPDLKIVFGGDLVTTNTGPYPIIHQGTSGVLAKHGSSLGWMRSMRAILALDADTYVFGHGDMPLAKAEVRRRLEAAESRRAEIAALFAKGLTLDEIRRALHEVPATGDAAMFPSFTETTYQELSRE